MVVTLADLLAVKTSPTYSVLDNVVFPLTSNVVPIVALDRLDAPVTFKDCFAYKSPLLHNVEPNVTAPLTSIVVPTNNDFVTVALSDTTRTDFNVVLPITFNVPPTSKVLFIETAPEISTLFSVDLFATSSVLINETAPETSTSLKILFLATLRVLLSDTAPETSTLLRLLFPATVNVESKCELSLTYRDLFKLACLDTINVELRDAAPKTDNCCFNVAFPLTSKPSLTDNELLNEAAELA